MCVCIYIYVILSSELCSREPERCLSSDCQDLNTSTPFTSSPIVPREKHQ